MVAYRDMHLQMHNDHFRFSLNRMWTAFDTLYSHVSKKSNLIKNYLFCQCSCSKQTHSKISSSTVTKHHTLWLISTIWVKYMSHVLEQNKCRATVFKMSHRTTDSHLKMCSFKGSWVMVRFSTKHCVHIFINSWAGKQSGVQERHHYLTAC